MEDDKELVQQFITSGGDMLDRKEFLEKCTDDSREEGNEDFNEKKTSCVAMDLHYHDVKSELDKKHNFNRDFVKMEIPDNHYEDVECEVEQKFLTETQIKDEIEETNSYNSGIAHYCIFCEFSTYDVRILEDHIARSHNGEKNEIPHEKEIKSHMKKPKKYLKKSKMKRFKCEHCDFSTDSSPYLKNHFRRIHLKEKSYNCTICSYSAFEEITLEIHMKKHEEDSVEYKFKCEHCEFSSNNPRKLKLHTKIHIKAKAEDVKSKPVILKCDRCKFTSNNLDSVKKHFRRIHLREKNHNCRVCSYSSFDKKGLRHHMKLHEADSESKKSKCGHCGFSTNYPKNLEIHIRRIHLKEKNYKCGVCSYSTFGKQDLVLHMKTHRTGVERTTFKCEHCEFRTVNPKDLETHIRRVHLGAKNQE